MACFVHQDDGPTGRPSIDHYRLLRLLCANEWSQGPKWQPGFKSSHMERRERGKGGEEGERWGISYHEGLGRKNFRMDEAVEVEFLQRVCFRFDGAPLLSSDICVNERSLPLSGARRSLLRALAVGVLMNPGNVKIVRTGCVSAALILSAMAFS